MADEKTTKNAQAVYAALCSTLDEVEWKYDRNDDGLEVTCGAQGYDLPIPLRVSVDADKTGAAIDQLKELWPKAVNEAVQRQLKREIPKADPKPNEVSFGAAFAQKYSQTKTANQNGGKE